MTDRLVRVWWCDSARGGQDSGLKMATLLRVYLLYLGAD